MAPAHHYLASWWLSRRICRGSCNLEIDIVLRPARLARLNLDGLRTG